MAEDDRRQWVPRRGPAAYQPGTSQSLGTWTVRSGARSSGVTDSLSQPLVTIGASRRSQSEQKRMGDPPRGVAGVMRFRLRR